MRVDLVAKMIQSPGNRGGPRRRFRVQGMVLCAFWGTFPDANHGAGIFTYIKTLKVSQDDPNVGKYSTAMVRIWDSRKPADHGWNHSKNHH